MPPAPEGLPDWLDDLPTCVAVLRARAARTPDRTAFRYLPDGEAEGEALTYGELDARARGLAATLQAEGLAGERVVLGFAPGLGFVVGFFACLYAGAVAVPIDLPEHPEAARRVGAIALDAGAAAILAPAAAAPTLARFPETCGLRVVALDAPGDPAAWREAEPGPEALAFLQYTSGSTAAPKGVAITHGNVLANQRLIHAAARQGPDAVFLSWLPLFHDMGLMGMVVQPVYVGAPCVLMPPRAFLARPRRWLAAISRYRATISGGPDFAFALAEARVPPAEQEGLDLASWRVAYSGSEPVSPATLDQFAAAFAPVGLDPAALYPCYGLAEATAFFTGGAPGAGPRVVAVDPAALAEGRAVPDPAGRALAACGVARGAHALAVVDPETGAPRPAGEVGEIWLKGPSVAAGYWNRPEETAATFGARMPDGAGPYLRTGDLGFVHDGEIVVCGRLKDLVIVRGRNHHPHDLEATVRGCHPALTAGEGACFTVPIEGEERLVVVHEVRPAQKEDGALFPAIRQALAAGHGLEPHAIALIKRGALPKTSSGKVRRRACRAAWLDGTLDALAIEARVGAWGAGSADAPGEPPATEGERRLAALWAEALGGPPPGRHDDFFAGGGDSLAAMRLVALVEDAFGVALPLGRLAEAPTLAGLAAAIVAAAPAEPWPALTPDPAAAHAPFPLNAIQLAYLMGRDAAVGLGGVATHAYVELELPAPDLGRLEAAIDRLVARHPALRTVVVGADRQRVLPAVPPYRVAVGTDAEAARAAMAAQVRPADRWPLFEVRATHLPGGRMRLHVAVDLLIADAWSLRLAARELAALYAAHEGLRPAPDGLPPALDGTGPAPDGLPPAPALAFRDYVLAEAGLAATARRARALAYWRERLPTLPPPPDLPAALARPAGGAGAFTRRQTVLPPATWRALRERAARAGLTPTGVLLAAYAQVLGAWSRGHDFTLNVTLFQRLPLHPDVERVVGDFTSLTLLAVEAPTAGPFGESARRLAARLWADLDHRLVGGLEVMRELARAQGLDRPTAMMPIVFTSTLVDGAADAEGELPPDVAIVHAASQTPQVLLDHQVHQVGGALHASWDALDAHFAPGVLDAMAAAHGALLHALATSDAAWGEAMDLVPADQAAAFAVANATAVPTPPALLQAGFAARRAERPDALAVVAGGDRLTYEAVGRLADTYAARLQALGARPGQLVAVVMAKGWEQVVGVLAALGAGAAYVPIDPGLPRERLHHLLGHAEAALALTTPDLDASLDWPAGVTRLAVRLADMPAEAPPTPAHGATPADLAYVIYTSGSTGLPKGVMIDHRGAWNTIADVNRRFGVGPADRVLALSSLGFDLSVYDVFGLLAAGGAIVMPTPAEARDPAAWAALLAREGVTLWNTVPALLELLLDHADDEGGALPAGLRLAMLSGDWIPLPLPCRLTARSPGCALVSLGGATEASIWSILHPVEGLDPAWRSVPYGRPMANQRFHVRDAARQPVPAWVPGDLYIGGDGLALGYWRDPARTDAAFVPCPHTGERLYRTGDLGRYWPDGTIEFLGREDFQVKVAGHRIELGEVEAALLAHPAVRAAVVVPDGPARGARRLLAYVVVDGSLAADEAAGVGPEALRAFVAAKLPAYMVPARVLPLQALPLGPNGKVDRRRLPAPDAGPAAAAADDAPRTEAERLIAALWAEVLGVPRVGRHDQFFALGGDSLAALRFLSRLRARHGLELAFGHLFEMPNVAELAVALETAPAAAAIRPVPRGGDLPLSFAQERLWFLDRLMPGTASYHVPIAARLDGALDVPRLEAALAAVLARHEGLRTAFVEVDGRPVARIAPAVAADIPIEDLPEAAEGLASAATLADGGLDAVPTALEARLRAEAGRPFDLAAPPLLRARLYRLAPTVHVLALTLHHLVCDGWSLGLLLRELGDEYAGEPVAPPPVHYPDYAAWEREALDGDRLAPALAYWRRQLGGQLPVLALPTDHPRPARPSEAGATATFLLPEALAVGLDGLARGAGATLFMALLAGFKAWLFGLTGQADMLVAAAAANRRHPETEGVIGLFVDTLGLRTDLGGDPDFLGLLARVREVVTGAQAHQELPLQRLVAALAPSRDAGGVPVVRVGFGMQAAPMPRLAIAGLDLAPVPVDTGAARADLTLLFWREAGGLRGVVEYRRDLFEAATIARWIAAYEAVLAAAVADPRRPISALTGASPRLGATPPTPTSEPAQAPSALVARAHQAPRTPTEEALVAIWEGLFERRPIGVHDDFFALGGDSLLAVRLMARVKRAFGRQPALATLFGEATIAALAAALDEPAAGDVLVPLASAAGAMTVYLVHALDGGVAGYGPLAAALAPLGVAAFQAPGLARLEAPAALDGLAAMYVTRLRAAQPAGPYHLAGWSLGGLVAFEMARQLRAAGAEVGSLTLIDAHLAGPEDRDLDDAALHARLDAAMAAGLVPAAAAGDDMMAVVAAAAPLARAAAAYVPGRYDGAVTFLAASPADGAAARAGAQAAPADAVPVPAEGRATPADAWRAAVAGPLRVVPVAAGHFDLLRPPHVEAVAAALRAAIAAPVEAPC